MGWTCMCLCALAWSSRSPVAANARYCATISAARRAASGAAEEEFEPEPKLVAAVHARRRRLRQDRIPLDNDEMQPDRQVRQRASPPHRIGGGGPGDHQARRGQDAVAVRLFDRLVDLEGQTEIIRRDDNAVQ